MHITKVGFSNVCHMFDTNRYIYKTEICQLNGLKVSKDIKLFLAGIPL